MFMNSTGNFNFNLEEILELTNPLIMTSNSLKSAPSILSNIAVETHQGLIGLNLKPTLKVDKKGKKVEKDDDRESDRTSTKIKVKKKIRSKVSFDEDYDPMAEVNEENFSETVAPLPLERPAKPILTQLFGQGATPKQKTTLGNITKKKTPVNFQSKKATSIQEVEKPTQVTISQPMPIEELAEIFNISKTELIKALFLKGRNVTLNQILDLSTIQQLGQDLGIEVSISSLPISRDDSLVMATDVNLTNSQIRSPIVTVMGHVDHGKTTLLDRIRNTQVAKKEAGGITQKIGAYEVDVLYKGSQQRITFLDTPGHAAFSAMRSRGVSVTDVVLLVVAADDGIKPQTIEAIQYAQSAKVPLVVAVNKMDKEDADITKLQEELAKYNIISEEWGGETLIIPISAMQGTNIEKLLESILLTTSLIDLRVNVDGVVKGIVLESNLDKTRGAVATAIVQTGTLQSGDTFISGESMSKVRGLINSEGIVIQNAAPSSPVIIWGLSKVPAVGEIFYACRTEKEAKQYMTLLKPINKVSYNNNPQLVNLYSENEKKEKLNLIIKTDTQGSAEAIKSTLNNIKLPKVTLRVLYACAGEITETDIDFASTSNSRLLAFNTTLASGTKKAATYSAVNIKEFDVIYDLFDYVDELIEDLVGPDYEEKFLGTAVVKSVFPLAKSFVAGAAVTEGKITKTSFVHVIRDSQTVYKGNLDSLKKVKEDVMEVSQPFECGIYIAKFDTWLAGDLIKAFELVEKKNHILRPNNP